MANVRLLDFMGYTVGEPNVPEPLPRVIVWGDDFFISNPEDLKSTTEKPRYHMTTGFVVIETKSSRVI